HRNLVQGRERQGVGNILGVQRLVTASLVRRDEPGVTVAGGYLLVGAASQELTPSIRTQEHKPTPHALLGFYLQGIIRGIPGILVGGRQDAAELRKWHEGLGDGWLALAMLQLFNPAVIRSRDSVQTRLSRLERVIKLVAHRKQTWVQHVRRCQTRYQV